MRSTLTVPSLDRSTIPWLFPDPSKEDFEVADLIVA